MEQIQAGAADQTELLNVQFEAAVAQITQLDNQIRLQQAMGALEDAVQRPILPKAIFEPEEKNLNAKARRREGRTDK